MKGGYVSVCLCIMCTTCVVRDINSKMNSSGFWVIWNKKAFPKEIYLSVKYVCVSVYMRVCECMHAHASVEVVPKCP